MDARELELDYSEVYRYLGYRKGIPEGEVKEVVERCVGELVAQAELRSVARRFPLEFLGEQRFRIGDMELESRALARNMRGCDEAYLMAATIGFAMDRLAARASAIGRMSRAVIYQAAGAMLIESYCDALNRKLKEEAAAKRVGNFLNVSLEELKTFARVTGHSRLHDLNVEDLVTTSREISEHTNIAHV